MFLITIIFPLLRNQTSWLYIRLQCDCTIFVINCNQLRLTIMITKNLDTNLIFGVLISCPLLNVIMSFCWGEESSFWTKTTAPQNRSMVKQNKWGSLACFAEITVPSGRVPWWEKKLRSLKAVISIYLACRSLMKALTALLNWCMLRHEIGQRSLRRMEKTTAITHTITPE